MARNYIFQSNKVLITGTLGLDVLLTNRPIDHVEVVKTGFTLSITAKVFLEDSDLVAYPFQIERVQFGDKLFALDVLGDAPANAGYVYKLYQVAFGREADIGGLSYWTAFSDDNGRNKPGDLAHLFASSPEFTGTLAPDYAGLVDTLYDRAFGREPDDAGREYWVDFLESGGRYGDLIEAFASSLEAASHFEARLLGGLELDSSYFPAPSI